MKILLFANTDWYLYNFRLALAKAIRDSGNHVVLVSPHGPYGEKLEKEGFRWIPVNMSRRGLNPWDELTFVVELVHIYKNEQPDIVHHFTIKSVVYGSLAARIAGIQNRINAVAGLGFVFTSQSLFAKLLQPIVRVLLRFAFSGKSARLILQNHDDFNYFLKQRFISPDHITLIRGSGVNTGKFNPANRKQNGDKRFRVLLATRLLWDKGVGEFVEAARILKNDFNHIQCLIAGAPDEGNPASISFGTLSRWSTEGTVSILGHVSDMPALLSEVDLVVLPSYREGTPRILLEAASCGLPLVATDVPGCREIVEHGINGLLVPAKDSVALAKAIETLSGSPDVCKRMGHAGRQKVLNEFDEIQVIQKTLAVYNQLCPFTG